MSRRRNKKKGSKLQYKLSKHRDPEARKEYLEYRVNKGLPFSCDMTDCILHDPLTAGNPVKWKKAELLLELDHVDGNFNNNDPGNLRLLCPNCHSQTGTYGAKNIDRIFNRTVNSYQIHEPNGGTSNVFIADIVGTVKISSEIVIVKIN